MPGESVEDAKCHSVFDENESSILGSANDGDNQNDDKPTNLPDNTLQDVPLPQNTHQNGQRANPQNATQDTLHS